MSREDLRKQGDSLEMYVDTYDLWSNQCGHFGGLNLQGKPKFCINRPIRVRVELLEDAPDLEAWRREQDS